MLYASLIAPYNAAEKPFANPCEDRPAKILPQFIRAGRNAPVFFRRFLSPLGERGFSARKQPSPGTRFPPTRNRRPSMKTQPETTPTLCPLPPRAFRATDGEHRAENEESPPRLPGLPRAEAEPQPEKFSEPDAIPFCSHLPFSYLWITWPDFISTYPSASASAPTATSTKASTCAAWTLFWSPCTANWTPGGNIWAASRCAPATSAAAPPRCAPRRPSRGCWTMPQRCSIALRRRRPRSKPIPTTSPPPTSPRCAARASTACRSASSRSTTRVSS